MSIILKKDKIEQVENINILKKLYFDLYVLPDPLEISSYNKQNMTDFQLEKMKEIIADITSQIPLFDIYSQNIYLIPGNKVYYYVSEKYYRLPNQKIVNYLEGAYKKAENSKLKSRLEKNINFINNYNLDGLYDTYLKVIYENSNEIGKNITTCRRVTYLPYLNLSPYYTRAEIINMSLNLKLIKPDNVYYDNEKLDNLCMKLIENDIPADILLKHQMYVEKNNAQHIIYYYTFYGSLYYNQYLRNEGSHYDKYVSNNVDRLFALIKRSPAFDNDYYVYRFITNDDYLEDVKVGKIFKEESFISTSRNAFYEPKNHVFGNILIKIKLPKNKTGIALCLETYSLFPAEQEILLAPGKLKLISIEENNFKYYHPDIKAQKEIKKKYEFEYIEPIDKLPTKRVFEDEIRELPENFQLISSDYNEKNLEFYRSIPIINDLHYFKWENYLFQVFYLDKVSAYYKYYFILEKEPKPEDIIFLVLQDEKTQEINIIIEIGEIISVNYLHKFTGAKSLRDDELLKIIQNVSGLFKINTVIIHPNYNKFENKLTKIPKYSLDEYYEEELMKFSADLTTYNEDIWDYILNKNIRFKNTNIINKMNLFTLDRLKRLQPDSILKIEDTDELYKIWKKSKINNVYDFLIYLQQNYFYLLSIIIPKINKVINMNPFIYGYYVYAGNSYGGDTNTIEEKFKNKLTNKNEERRRR